MFDVSAWEFDEKMEGQLACSRNIADCIKVA